MEIGIRAENYGLPSLLGRDILNEWSMRYRAAGHGGGANFIAKRLEQEGLW